MDYHSDEGDTALRLRAATVGLLMKPRPSLLDEYDRSDFDAALDPSPARRSRLNRHL